LEDEDSSSSQEEPEDYSDEEENYSIPSSKSFITIGILG